MKPQMIDDEKVDRRDHVWAYSGDGEYYCTLCGARTDVPPPYPTPVDWKSKEYPEGKR